VAVAVVDLKSRTVVAVSPMFSDLVGSAAEVDLHVLVDDPEVLGPLMDLLTGGVMDAYEVRRELDLGGGRRLWADCWPAVCERERRHHALWALSPVDDERAPAIARALNLSQSTVRNTLSDIFAKLRVHSQEELLRVLRPEAPSRRPSGIEKGGLPR
jgi:DNA-binding CsgD family transcriptional regulator